MLAFVTSDHIILGLQAHFHQPHVIFFFEVVQSQDRAQNCCGFHTNEYGGMDTARDDGAINRRHEEIHGMLINLANQCR